MAKKEDKENKKNKIKYQEPVKFDNGKPRLDLIAPELMFELGKILKFGADKYEDRNWELGIDYGRYYAALQRHLWAWWSGEDNDKESGEHHLSHAACCLMFLLASNKRKIGKDTRYKKENNGKNKRYS